MARELRWIPPAHTGLDPIILTDRNAGWRVFTNHRGLGAVERYIVTADSPFIDGTEVDDDYALPRTVLLPMMMWAPTRAEMLAKLRSFQAALRTRKPGNIMAPGELELAQADGRRFRVRCHYRGGLPNEETVNSGGDQSWVRFTLELFAPDPYWYGAEAVTASWVFSDPTAFLGATFLPLNISAAQVIGDAEIINSGTEDAYGTWRVTGPGSALILTNPGSGEALQVNGSIPGGQVLTIVTDPFKGDITLEPAGTDWWVNLADNSKLWSIPPGTTEVSLALTGAAAGSRIDLEFYEKFGSPW